MQKKLVLLKIMWMELTQSVNKMLDPKKTRFYLTLLFLVLLVYSCEEKEETNNNIPKPKPNTKSVVRERGPKILPDSLLKFHLLGKCDYKYDTCFISVPLQYCYGKIYLQKETCQKFIEMHQAANKDSISIIINSGARNFYAQKSIWDRKWRAIKRKKKKDTSNLNIENKKIALEILLKCAMPSTSRHHWGTDIDIFYQSGNEYFDTLEGKKQYHWMKKNAHKFGFQQVYTDKNKTQRRGYEEEKWHWSYVPIANKYTKKYAQLISYNDITGFNGSNLAEEIKAIEHYVYGIDKKFK